ncbi:MAG: tryptophan synthase subunit alpha [Chloroflexi bacterium]|nr:tryptophan synthase subunit alpha [Chloroflexota bacterium]
MSFSTNQDTSDRISKMFNKLQKESRPALIPFIPAGWPEFDATISIVKIVEKAGADAIELGLPFSDPLADGVTNQNAYYEAIQQGTNTSTVLETVKLIRKEGIEFPIILMGYFNPIFAYGSARWIRDAKAAGVDALIIVDLPPGESRDLEFAAKDSGLHLIYLVAPTSNAERLKHVANYASGFLYCVSLTGTTGARSELSSELPDFIQRVREYIDLPLAIGFGISERKHVEQVGKLADAAIIGSAFVRTISEASLEERSTAIVKFIRQMKGEDMGIS